MKKYLSSVAVLLFTASERSAQAADETVYEVMPPDTSGCKYDGYEDLTEQQCEVYAAFRDEDIPYGGVSQWSDEPKGCHISKCIVSFNTDDTGARNINSAPMCKRSISNVLPPQTNPESYLVMNARTNRCSDGSEPVTPVECFMYTCFTPNPNPDPLNRPSYGVGNWPADPKGCIISYGDTEDEKVVYFNEHATGVGNDNWLPVCKPPPPPGQFVFDGPVDLLFTVADAPAGVILLPPIDYELSFTIEPLGTISEVGGIILFITADLTYRGLFIYFSKDSTKLSIQIDRFPTHQTSDLELNKRHDVVLTVVGSTTLLSINGRREVRSITARSVYEKLDVYIGSPVSEPANAIISDIQFFPTAPGYRSNTGSDQD